MNSITYSASQDPFHAVFRMSAILEFAEGINFEVERLFIYDFYVCFPWRASTIRGSQKIAGFIRDRNVLRRTYLQNVYEQIPDPRVMLRRMRASQLAAINSLGSYGFVDTEMLRGGVVKRTSEPLPATLMPNITAFIAKNKILLEFLVMRLNEVPLAGADGLKDRSGLEEFRYDYV